MKQLSRATATTLFSILLAFGDGAHAAEDFAACPQFFANARPPVVAARPALRTLCYDAFAILHSGESKTPVFVAEKLNRASVADANEKRTNRFFADATCPSQSQWTGCFALS